MHDIEFIRNYPDKFDAEMFRRNEPPIARRIIELDKTHRKRVSDLQLLQHERKSIARQLSQTKDKSSQEFMQYQQRATAIKDSIRKLEHEIQDDNELKDILHNLPNILSADLVSEETEIRNYSTPKNFDFIPKHHFELGEQLNMMDFTHTAKISGSRFSTLSGHLALLERALANFMLSVHIHEYGYLELSPPLLVHEEAMFGTGKLPKFDEDSFATTNNMRLIPTSEVPLTCMVYDSIVQEKELPLRYVAYTPCFRSEAGSAGRDTRGMIRMHQFNKVELVSITHPKKSGEEHERMTEAAESILKKLDLPYRTIMLPDHDTGFCASKTYDIEVWLPGQNTYREISSCSNDRDFCARRMKARFKCKDTNSNILLHTLNGSGIAVGRALVAVLENYQQKDGSIIIPEVLRPFMNNMYEIK